MDTRSQALFGKDVVRPPPRSRPTSSPGCRPPSSREARAGVDFFTAIKSMTITGYYTTEVGLDRSWAMTASSPRLRSRGARTRNIRS